MLWTNLLSHVVLCLVGIGVAQAQNSALVFPQFAQGGGIECELVITNPGDNLRTGTVRFLNDQGEPLELQADGASFSSWPFSLLPGGVARLKMERDGPLKVGYSELLLNGEETNLGTSLIYNFNGQASVTGTKPVEASHVAVETNAQYNSGIAIINPSANPQDIRLLLLNEDGLLQAEKILPLGPRSHTALFIDQLFPNLPTTFAGTLHAAAPDGMSMTGLRQNRVDGSLGVLSGGRGAFGVTRRWLQSTAAAPFSPRLGHKTIAYAGKLWVIGGISGATANDMVNDVWCSEDGIRWTQVTAAAGFSPRCYAEAVVFQDKLWVIAGHGPNNTIHADVWYSDDGIAWHQATGAAEFGPRWLHSALSYRGRLWVIAGTTTGPNNDVWSSNDGVHWQQVSSHAGFSPRSSTQAVVFKDKIWVVAGGVGAATGNLSDVWCSEDGQTWTQITPAAGFPERHAPRIAVWDDALWMTSGVANGRPEDINQAFFNDLWKSSDGEHWTQVQTTAQFPSRMAPDLALFGNRLWLIGGGRVEPQLGMTLRNDVWYLF